MSVLLFLVAISSYCLRVVMHFVMSDLVILELELEFEVVVVVVVVVELRCAIMSLIFVGLLILFKY